MDAGISLSQSRLCLICFRFIPVTAEDTVRTVFLWPITEVVVEKRRALLRVLVSGNRMFCAWCGLTRKGRFHINISAVSFSVGQGV